MTSDPDAVQPDDRVIRPDPERTDPIRDGWTSPGSAAPDSGATAAAAPTAPLDGSIEEIVHHSVRVGYSVIEENLKHGRAAADRFGAGAYRPEHVSDDLKLLSERLLTAAREFGTLWLDLIGAVMRDPRLANALQPQAPSGTATTNTPTPPAAPQPVPLTCAFPGKAGTLVSASLTRPEAPTRLAVSALHDVTNVHPPITSIGFLPPSGGAGVTALVTIDPEHPPGTYMGVITDAASQAALGAMAVRVDT